MSNGSVAKRLKVVVQTKSSESDIILSALAEFLGTGTLVFLGCMGCIGSLSVTPTHLQMTLNFGLAVLIVVQCFGHISHAHVNPAITLGAVVLGKKSVKEGLIYLVAQVSGGIMGFGLLKALTPYPYLSSGSSDSLNKFCVTDLNPIISPIQGLIVEIVATAILMLVACAIWDPRNAKNTDSVAIKFGLIVAALATAAGPYTGCSMNPARTMGPAFWNNYWHKHWIYWIGPLGGSFLAALAYKTAFWPADEEEEDVAVDGYNLTSVEAHKTEH